MTRGVIFIKERPARDAVADANVHLRMIQDRHSVLHIPNKVTPSGTKDVSLWAFWAPAVHPEYDATVTVPSVFQKGCKSMEFQRHETYKLENAQKHDISLMVGLQHIFDMHYIAGMPEHISPDEKLDVSLLYIMSIRVAISYHDKMITSGQDSEMVQMFRKLTPIIRTHESVVKTYGIDVSKIDNFRSQVQCFAQSLCKTAFCVDSSYSESSLRMLAMCGMAILTLLHHQDKDVKFYKGFALMTDGERTINMLHAYQTIVDALSQTKQNNSMMMTLEQCLLGGDTGITHALKFYALVVDDNLTCAKCHKVIKPHAVSMGSCHICTNMEVVLCQACSEGEVCKACEIAASLVDFKTVAIEAVARSTVLMRQHAHQKKATDIELRALKEQLASAQDQRCDPKLTYELECVRHELKSTKAELKKERRQAKKQRSTPACDEEHQYRIQNADLDAQRNEFEVQQTAFEARRSQFAAQQREFVVQQTAFEKQRMALEEQKSKGDAQQQDINAERKAIVGQQRQVERERNRLSRDVKSHGEQLSAYRGVVDELKNATSAKDASNAKCDALTRECAAATLRYDETIAERDAARCACAALRADLHQDDGAISKYEAMRMEILETQRRAFSSNLAAPVAATSVDMEIMRDELEVMEKRETASVQLNSVWKEKYAFEAGRNKANEATIRQLVERIPILTDDS